MTHSLFFIKQKFIEICDKLGIDDIEFYYSLPVIYPVVIDLDSRSDTRRQVDE
jgi:hypothetical protein